MQSWQDHKDRARGEWAFAMGHVAQNTGSLHVFWAGGGGFSSVLQMHTLAGWETEVPMGLARTAVVLCTGPRTDEPTGQGRAMAEVGFHSDLLCSRECGRDFVA